MNAELKRLALAYHGVLSSVRLSPTQEAVLDSVRKNPGRGPRWHASAVARDGGWFANRGTFAALERKGHIRYGDPATDGDPGIFAR